MDKMSTRYTTLTKWIITCAVLLGLMLHPATRRLLLFILPLGRKPDDLIVIGILIILGVLLFWKGFLHLPKLPKFFRKIDDEERGKTKNDSSK